MIKAGGVNFDPNEYETYGRMEPIMMISSETFDSMKEELDEIINRDPALLDDDIMLKKMLLTYYRGIYLDKTTVLIEITAEDLGVGDKIIDENGNEINVWRYYDEKDPGTALEGFSQGFATGATIGGLVGHAPGAIIGGLGLGIAGLFDAEDRTRVQLTNAAEDWLNQRKDDFFPYNWVQGNTYEGIGQDGHLYLKTTGMVQIYVACDKCNGLENNGTSQDTYNCETCQANKVIYFSEETFNLLYQKEYIDELPNCDRLCKGIDLREGETQRNCYAHNALEYLKKVYVYDKNVIETTNQETTSEDTTNTQPYSNQSDYILMYSQRIKEDEAATIEYINESKKASNPHTGWEHIKSWFSDPNYNPMVRNYIAESYSPVTLQTINYGEKVAEYATPMELMVDLLAITSSKDFVNAFMATVGNDNYIKLKLYTTRNRDIKCITQEFDRKTEINAETTGTFEATVKKRNKDGSGVDNAKDENAKIQVEIEIDPTTNTITVGELIGAEDGYHYKINIDLIYTDGTSESLTNDDDKWLYPNGTIYEEHTRYKIQLPDDALVALKWTDNSKVMKLLGTSKVTDQYYPAISELKTWYGTYTAVNSINREYSVDQLIANDKLTLNQSLLNEGMSQEIIDYMYAMEEQKAMLKDKIAAYDNNSGTYNSTIDVDLREIKDINYRYIETYTIMDFYEEISKLNEVLPVGYSKVEDYDDEWNTVTNFNSDSGEVFRLINYNDTIKAENYWGEITFNINNNYGFTENGIRNAQLNYITQCTQEDFSEKQMRLPDIQKYQITNMSQIDQGLYVTELTMHYSETVQEGLTDGNRLPNNDKIQEFLGLLCNEYGKYILGEKFEPESSGGQLVDYEDVEHKVASRLEENESLLYQLLSDFPRTQRLVKVMKIIMYIYKNDIFQVNEWQFDVYGDGMVNVYNSSGGMIDITE